MYLHMIHMKRSFSKRNKRQSKNRVCSANGDHFWKTWRSCFGKESFNNIYMYICICEKPFSNTQSVNLALALQAQFF